MVKISFIDKEKKKKVKVTDKLKKERDYSKYIDRFILFMIVFTSVNVFADISYMALPIFLSVVFILIQFKRLVTKKVEVKK